MSVEYVSGVCRSICRLILDRHSTKTADLSADTRPTSRPTLGQDIDRHLVEFRPRWRSSMSVGVSTEFRPTYRPSLDRYWRLTVYQLEENFDRRSTKCRSISRPSVGRDVGRVSVEWQPRCRWSMWVECVARYLG